MPDKKISFSAQDNGLTSMMKKIRQEASDITKGMIADAVKYTQSGKEQLTFLNEELAVRKQLLETFKAQSIFKAGLRRETSLLSASTTQEREKVTSVYKEKLADISSGTSKDDMQLKMMREMIDAIKQTSKEEILQDKKATELEVNNFNKMSQSQKAQLLPEERLKRGLQQQELGRISAVEGEERKLFDSSRGKQFNTLAKLGSSKNELYAAVAVASMIPIVGEGIGALVNKAISEGEALQTGRMKLGATMGLRSQDAMRDLDLGSLTDIGITKAQSFEFANRLARNRGYANTKEGGIGGSTRGLMAQMQLYGLDEGQIMNISRIQGFDRNRRDTFGDIENFRVMMQQGGRMQGGDLSELPKLLEIQNDLIMDQTTRLEEGNSNAVTRGMLALSSLGGSFSAKGTMASRYKSLDDALRQPSGDFRQAITYSALRELDPSMSFFEMKEMQEQGILAETKGGDSLINKVMQQLKAGSGSKDTNMLQLMEFFGLSATQSRAMFEGYDPEEFKNFARDEDLQRKFGFSKEGAVRTARKITPGIKRMTAETSDLFAPLGEAVIEKFSGAVDSLKEYLDNFGGTGIASPTARADSAQAEQWSILAEKMDVLIKQGKQYGDEGIVLQGKQLELLREIDIVGATETRPTIDINDPRFILATPENTTNQPSLTTD